MDKLYDIHNLKKATFIDRPNRFVANITYKNKPYRAHIHDPGRLKELLLPGAELLMTESKGKLDWYVKAVKNENEWVIIDSAQQRKIATQLFKVMDRFKKVKEIKAEVPLGKSRIDFTVDGVPLENKGVSLVKDGVALFPDAPTKRGTRHVYEIIKHNGMLLFIIFRKAEKFRPNREMDPKFADAMVEAREKGIEIICAQVYFDGKSIYYTGTIPLDDF